MDETKNAIAINKLSEYESVLNEYWNQKKFCYESNSIITKDDVQEYLDNVADGNQA